MELLTSDSWLPNNSISAVLTQIKLAISNLDPKPATGVELESALLVVTGKWP